MKKILQSILIIVFTITIFGCSKEAPSYENVNIDSLQNTYLEKPVKGRPKSQDPINNIFIALNTLKTANYYKSSASGQVVAKKAVTLATQNVNTNRIITPNATFVETKSISSFVKVAEQLYITDSKVLKRDAKKASSDSVTWNNSATSLSNDAYLQEYGYSSKEPTRYIINESTIISDIEVLCNGTGRKYTYKFSLDPILSTYYYRTNVKNTAGASDYPIFKKIEMTMTFDYKWRMTRIQTYEEYSISMSGIGKVNCEATLIETFKNINQQVSIEQEAFFKKYI